MFVFMGNVVKNPNLHGDFQPATGLVPKGYFPKSNNSTNTLHRDSQEVPDTIPSFKACVLLMLCSD